MKRWMKTTIPLIGFSLLSLLFIWGWVHYLYQRPWPPELTGPLVQLESGDVYVLKWTPAKTGPQAEFYYLQESVDPKFKAAKSFKITHKPQSGQQESGSIVAPAGSGAYYYRVVAAYTGNLYFGLGHVTSEPSNVVSVSIKSLASPSLYSSAASVYSGQSFSVSWAAISKANTYHLKQITPNGIVKNFKNLVTNSKTITAPPLKQNGQYSYQVKAAKALGSNSVDITDWSSLLKVSVTHVSPPSGLKVEPASAYSPQPYKVSWVVPGKGPQPTVSYSYSLREKQASQAAKLLPLQTKLEYTAVAPMVNSQVTVNYEVMAYFGGNPMTFYSPSVQLQIMPPPPPPLPAISSVNPSVASKGAKVTLTGSNLATAKIELYSSSKSVAVKPTSQTASKVVFQVPTSASLRTTQVLATVGGVKVKKSFQVARNPGKFVQRQSSVQMVTHNCGNNYKAEIDLPGHFDSIDKKYHYSGRFKEGSKILKNFPYPSGFIGSNIAKTGLGFSQVCKVGIMVAESGSPGIVQPFYLNYYNIAQQQDSNTSPGTKINGPAGFHPSPFFVEGYRLLFSPDETIAALISRHKQGPTKLLIYVTDMLTGKLLYSGGFSDPTFIPSVEAGNNLSQPGASGAPPNLVPIPMP